MRRLVEFYPELKVGYARIVTISTDNLLQTNEFRNSLGAEWPFLSDTRRIVQKDLDIQEYTDPHHDPMIPYTLVLEPGLAVHKIYNGYWYWGRPSVFELYQDLREVTRKHAPDWDLSTPGLREKWESEERSAFFPYGRSRRDTLAIRWANEESLSRNRKRDRIAEQVCPSTPRGSVPAPTQ